MGFPRQEYWNGLPFHSPGGLSNPGIKPGSPTLQADSLTSEPPVKPQDPMSRVNGYGHFIEEQTEVWRSPGNFPES